MSLPDDLFVQAQQLAQWDARRPKQVNLRRAISSAYYALFHLLSSETSTLFAAELGLAARINRTLNHGDVRYPIAEARGLQFQVSCRVPLGSTPGFARIGLLSRAHLTVALVLRSRQRFATRSSVPE